MSSSGRPSQEVVWLKDGHIIETKGNRKYIHRRLKRKLEIRQLDVNDSGIYECAINPNSTERGRAELWGKQILKELTLTSSLKRDILRIQNHFIAMDRNLV